jgi:hypothetical protein
LLSKNIRIKEYRGTILHLLHECMLCFEISTLRKTPGPWRKPEKTNRGEEGGAA